VSWKLSRTVLRGAVGGNADCLLDKKLEKGVREPYAIGLKTGETFCFAGIWEAWIEKPAAIRMRVDQAAERARRRAESQRPEEQLDSLFLLTPQEQNDESKPDPDADPTPRVLETFAVITCDPNEVVANFTIACPSSFTRRIINAGLNPVTLSSRPSTCCGRFRPN